MNGISKLPMNGAPLTMLLIAGMLLCLSAKGAIAESTSTDFAPGNDLDVPAFERIRPFAKYPEKVAGEPVAENENVVKGFIWNLKQMTNAECVPSDEFIRAHTLLIHNFPLGEPDQPQIDVAYLRYAVYSQEILVIETMGIFGKVVLLAPHAKRSDERLTMVKWVQKTFRTTG